MKTRFRQYQRNLKSSPKLYKAAERMYAEEDDVFGNVCTYVLSPVMCCYVAWIIQEALRTGKKRLYFMARDGYLMYRGALMICQSLKIAIECKYIYCSRYSLRNAEYWLMGDRLADYICIHGMDNSFGRMMERAGLTKGQGRAVAGRLGMIESYDLPLGYQAVERLKEKLVRCELFMNFVRIHSRGQYDETCRYLESEGFMQDIPYAIVDSGWTGSMQKSLTNLLKSMGVNKRLEGYYFGLYQIPKEANPENYHTYFFSQKRGLRRKVYFNNNLFECICSAPHGMTIAYKNAEPVFYEKGSRNQEKVRAFEKIWIAYISRLLTGDICLDELSAMKNGLIKSLELFMGNPVKEEAECFGSYFFCDDVVGIENISLARKLSAKELRDNFLWNRIINRMAKSGRNIKESAWLEGSIVLYGESKAVALFRCRLLLYIRYIRMGIRNKRWLK